ncbi:Bifunctional DNA primase/polymerase, N-terminal [Methylobacterium sp. ap11]|uniref:bifunctional DNA primase/polymerase n=1 Tax=Methylobacterium sp. ap11 TaxID=1761799 RepID=UPI0008D81063|nr:bifunctional DNA primase/polymerase [Methylobacterium sp. ap11]SEO94395.1 Bifunctional DNA primase/polymerase, N-terminal [Methylobacterium sp. ap11]
MTQPIAPPEHLVRVAAAYGGIIVPPSQSGGGVEELTQRWPIFGPLGPRLLARGWAVYPQGRDRRAPLQPPGLRIAGRPEVSPRELSKTLPDPDKLRWWAINHPYENIAAVMGPAGGVFALDLDITDANLCRAALAIVEEELGGRPYLLRHARNIKCAILLGWDHKDPIWNSRKLSLLDGEGCETDHAIEVLGKGKSLTLFGRHHRTGQPFGFLHGRNPLTTAISDLAVVGRAALQRILDRIDREVCPLSKIKAFDGAAPATGAIAGAEIDAHGLVKPGGPPVKDTTYVNGKVVDGREAWLRDRAIAWCVSNPKMAATDPGRRLLARHLTDEAERSWAGWGSFESRQGVQGPALQRVCSAQGYIERTPNLMRRVGREENGKPILAVRAAVKVQRETRTGSLEWLSDDLLGSVSFKSVTTDGQSEKAVARALVFDGAVRRAEQDRVAEAVRAGIDLWIDQAYRRAASERAPLAPIQVLKAPTGAGKTSTLIERLAEAKRRRGAAGAPILVLMPSYVNIDESIARSQGRQPGAPVATDRFKRSAADATLEAEGLGLDVGILTGKERGGCRMTEHLTLLRGAKLPASGLCSGDDETPAQRKMRIRSNRANIARRKAGEDAPPAEKAPKAYCRHHPLAGGDCPVILARRALAAKDVVFAPTAFITAAIPAELSEAFCAVAVDERVSFEMMAYATMPVSRLERERAAPQIKDTDPPGTTPDGLLAERRRVADIAIAALERGEDVALAIHRHPDHRVRECVGSALTVVRRAQRGVQDVRPNMPIGELKALVSKPIQGDLREETKFWALVEERLALLAEDDQISDLAGGRPQPDLLKVTGERDVRLQVLAPGMLGKDAPMTVRMSWRRKPNLGDLPLVLLDASADVGMIRKVWDGRDVDAVEIPAYLHLQTVAVLDASYATSSLDPAGVEDPKLAKAIARRVVKVRRAETVLSTVFGQGRVLTVAPRRVRKALRVAYAETENIDTGHYGAMRGLDFAKAHKAVLTVGRHEFPTWIVDALAACLAYDDPEPESPFDVNGNGLRADGEPLRPHQVERSYPLRDGRDLKIMVSEMPGRWGKAIQRQFREEEQLQAAGRLRPVYREGEPPVWVAMSKVLPEGIVIDAVTSLDKLSDPRGAGKLLDAIRRVGVVDPELLAGQARDLSGVQGLPAQMRALDLDKAGKASAFGGGFDLYAVKVGGEERFVPVPAYHIDPVSAVCEAYDRSGLSVQGVRLVAKGSDSEPSRRKILDRIDAEIGTSDERAEAEAAARDAVVAGKRGEPPAGPRRRPEVGFPLVTEPGQDDVAADVVLVTQGLPSTFTEEDEAS